jgi:hypothetical protein
MATVGRERRIEARAYSASGRSSVAWHDVHTHVRSRMTRWGSRLSVHGIIFFAPHTGQRSVR